MATLQIKNFPDDLHAKLAEEAKAERTTMSEYATRRLRGSLGGSARRPPEQLTMSEWLEELDRVLPSPVTSVPVDSAELIRQVRDEAEEYFWQGYLDRKASAA